MEYILLYRIIKGYILTSANYKVRIQNSNVYVIRKNYFYYNVFVFYWRIV